MIARLRARLHGLRRGHQTYADVFAHLHGDGTPWNVPWRCHGCDRRWIA